MTANPFAAFEFDADDARQVLADNLAGADDGELFVETASSESLAFDDGRLKVANFDSERGYGLRGVFGETTGFAHSNDPTLAALKRAGETAAAARKGRDAVMAPPPPGTNMKLYDDIDVVEQPGFEAKAKLQEAEAKAHDAYTEVARLEDALEEARLVAAQMAPAVEAAQAKVEQASRQVVEEAQAAIGKAYSVKEDAKAAVDAAKAEVDSVIGGIESVKAIPAAVAAMRPVLATAQALLVREIAALEEADVAVRKAESHAKSVAQGKRNHVW